MKQRLCFVLILIASSTVAVAQEPPDGFTWQQIPEIKVKVLVPPGWHFSGDSAKHVYHVTKEEYVPGPGQPVGLTLTFERVKSGAVEQAQKFVRATLAGGKVVMPFFEEDYGTMKGYGGIVALNPAKGSPPLTVAMTVVANPVTSALYKFTFRSPTEGWDSEWETGQWLVGRIKLDDEY